MFNLTRSQWDRVFILTGSALGAIIFTILVMTTDLANGSTNTTNNLTGTECALADQSTMDEKTRSDCLEKMLSGIANFLLPSVYATSAVDTIQVCPPLCGNTTNANASDSSNITSLATNPNPNTIKITPLSPDSPLYNQYVKLYFQAVWDNTTEATLNTTTYPKVGDLMVQALNAVMKEQSFIYNAEDSKLIFGDPEELEELPEEETEEEQDDQGGSDDGGSGGGGSGDPNLDPGVGINPLLGPGISYDCNGDGLIDRTYPCDDPTIQPMPSEDEGKLSNDEPEPQPEPEPEQPEDPPEDDDGGSDGGDEGDGGGDAGDGGGNNVAQ